VGVTLKTFYFMAGLPRSGSTLISSILNQNPNIYSSANSPMCGMMFNLERSILASEQYSAYPKPQVMSNTVLGIINGYYSDTEKNIVIDKSREWSMPEHFAVLLRNLPYEPKIILPVRSITDILASFISLVGKNPGKPNFIDSEINSRQEFNFYRPPNDTRCDHLMRPKGLIDNALYGIAYALQPENKKYFHFVEYDDLVNSPKEEIDKIYEFLGIDKFDHDYYNIENRIKEDDNVYGLTGQHDVRSSVSRRNIDKNNVLSQYVINKYSGQEFWRNNEATH
jgi:sulfotransferase